MGDGVKIPAPLKQEDLQRMTPNKLRAAYKDLAQKYTSITENDVIYCNKCNTWKKKTDFYKDATYKSGKFPVCKQCMQFMDEQRTSITQPVRETKESLQKVLRYMDKPYFDKLYGQFYKKAVEQTASDDATAIIAVFPSYMTCINSLQQYSNKTWDDSDFGDSRSIDDAEIEEVKIVKKTVLDGKKRFGAGYTDEELMFLENEYQDWISRYECNTKAQEKVFKNLAMVELQKDRAIKKNQPTKDLDKAYQDWLDAGNLKPKQNSMDSFSDAQSFGTLIQKYEDERPLPEIDPELEDVDNLGLYIDVFFRGHMCKVLGIKNRFSMIYENFMKRYTVTPPEYEEDEDSEAIFDKIFGGNKDG